MPRYLCMALGFVVGALLVGVLGKFEPPADDLRWPLRLVQSWSMR